MARRGVWTVAAIAQALAIAGLLVWLAVREAPARASGDLEGRAGPSRAEPSVEPAGPVVLPEQDAAPSPPRDEATGLVPVEIAAVAMPDIGAVLHGEVRVHDGKMPPSVSLTLLQGEGAAQVMVDNMHTQTARYAFGGLAAGDYRLRAKARGFREYERTVTIHADRTAVRADVELEPSWLVEVDLRTPNGQPLLDVLKAEQKFRTMFADPVQVVAWWRALPPRLPMLDIGETSISVAPWTSRRGALRGSAAGLPPRFEGVLEMPAVRDAVVAVVFREIVLVQQPITAGQDEVTLTVDPDLLHRNLAGVRLQVVDAATGRPANRARVGISDKGWPQFEPTDDQGRFEKSDLRPGRYEVILEVEGREGPKLQVELPPARTTDLGAIAFSVPVDLRIHVPELADTSSVGLGLDALDVPGGGLLTRRSVWHFVQKGRATLEVAPGRYRVRVAHEGRGAWIEVDTRRLGGETLIVELTDQPALQIDPSSLDEPVRCAIDRVSGESVFDHWIRVRNPFHVPLPAGDYRVRIERLGEPVREQLLTLPPEGTTLLLH